MGAEERHIAVAQRHNDNHWFDLACREEVVEDKVGAASRGPADGRVAPAMEKIEDRIGLRLRVVVGRSVDVICALVIGQPNDGGRGVDVVVDGAVWDVGVVPWLGRVAGDGDEVGDSNEVDGGRCVGWIEAS